MRLDDTFPFFMHTGKLVDLLAALRARGFRCMAGAAENGAIAFREIAGNEGLPKGIQVEQSPGRYKLGADPEGRYFAWANGPQAIKPLVFAPREDVWRVQRNANGKLEFKACRTEPDRIALIGVRACDLAALKLQDAHFLEGEFPDANYKSRREGLFLVAVQCAEPAATCFCASTGDGPTPSEGFDLSLVELPGGFLIYAGSERGHEVLAMLKLDQASPEKIQSAREQGEAAARKQSRRLPSQDLRPLIMNNLEHARWDEVAARCLSCGNCTAVCPTCFCSSEFDEPANFAESAHIRQWDSCFNEGHAYIHGHNVRPDTRSRYRQWLSHKLASWHDQYGRSGCVGCGRCISWCPAGIDLTEEIAAIGAKP